MKRIPIVLLLALPLSLLAQKIRYDFSAPNAVHHEAEIMVTVSEAKPGTLTFRMSRSSPGRYATHEFGKNVYNVSAVNANGKPLKVEKIDAEVYQVKEQKGTVKLKYTLFGNYADGTYARIDRSGYHLNMPATFMWVKGLDNAPITIHFDDLQQGWTIATQLKPSADPHTFTAPGLQYFMDSPTKIGSLHWREWKVTNPNGKEYTFRLALEADAADSTIDSFTERLKRVVKEAQAVFGEVPDYDYGTYTFLASLNPYVHGDGMEHRNSTMISSGRQFTGANNFLSTFAHEFFHCWNVERIRPRSLEPFNFEKSNMSEGLWVAEGFTQYYTSVLMKRAALISESDFANNIAGLINGKENTPGGKYYSPVENSQRAVFVDAGVSVDQTNYPNMFTSYYTYGAALALALDLQMRAQFGKSLDGFMQQMWKNFGQPGKPYTLPAMQQVLANYTSPAFAKSFFEKQVYGHEPIDYNSLLHPAGMGLKKATTGKAWIGNVRYNVSNNMLSVTSNTIRNTPLHNAGVDVDDVLLEMDGAKLQKTEDVESVLAAHHPGDVVKLKYRHQDQVLERDLRLEESPFVMVVVDEAKGNELEFRNNWIDSHVN